MATPEYSKLLLCGCIVLWLCTSVQAQTDFDKAHALLTRITTPYAEGEAKGDKERFEAEVRSAPLEIERLLNNGILDTLNASNAPSASGLQKRLDTTLKLESSEGNPPAFVFVIGTQAKPFFLVAYDIAYCAACGRSWIGVFGPLDERYYLVTSLENPFPNQGINVLPLTVSGESYPYFLAYGTNWGDAHSRLNVAVYRFDGHQLRTVWSRSGLVEGKVNLMSGGLLLSFLTTLTPPFTERTEIYKVTPQGIELQSASEEAVR